MPCKFRGFKQRLCQSAVGQLIPHRLELGGVRRQFDGQCFIGCWVGRHKFVQIECMQQTRSHATRKRLAQARYQGKASPQGVAGSCAGVVGQGV